METKMITIPFNIELAKKIQAEKHPGKIITRDGKDVKVLCFDAKRSLPIVSLVTENEKEQSLNACMSNGSRYSDGDVSRYDLFLQVPEWTQYKEGDLLKAVSNTIIVFNRFDDDEKVKFHAALDKGLKLLMYPLSGAFWGYKEEIERYASEDEKQMFVDKLKKENSPEAKDILKRFFNIEEKQTCKFEPFQKVIVRSLSEERWQAAFFSHCINGNVYPYRTTGGSFYKYCIPFNDETKHLIGTTDNFGE